MTFKTLALVLAAALLLKTCLQQQHGLPGLIKGGLWERSGPLGEVTASEVAADMWAPGSQARIAPGRMLGASANLNGKLAVVTGANTGLGKETARVLASQGCHVVLACRNEGRCREAASDIMTMSAEDAERGGSVEVMQLDLASLASVRAFAEVLLSKMDEGWGYNWQRIDFLINNAGIVSSLSVPPSLRSCRRCLSCGSHSHSPSIISSMRFTQCHVACADGATELRGVYRRLRETVCHKPPRPFLPHHPLAAAARRRQPHHQPLFCGPQASASNCRPTPAAAHRGDLQLRAEHLRHRAAGCRCARLRHLEGVEHSLLTRATETPGRFAHHSPTCTVPAMPRRAAPCRAAPACAFWRDFCCGQGTSSRC